MSNKDKNSGEAARIKHAGSDGEKRISNLNNLDYV